MDTLNDDELLQVAVNINNLYNFFLVSRRFSNISNNNSFWRQLYIKRFYLPKSYPNFNWKDKFIKIYNNPKYRDINGEFFSINELLCGRCLLDKKCKDNTVSLFGENLGVKLNREVSR